MVDQSVAAVEAGAAIIHLHARDPQDGRPTADPAVFLDYLKGIKDSTDAVVSITSGGGTGMSVADRLPRDLRDPAGAVHAQPRARSTTAASR